MTLTDLFNAFSSWERLNPTTSNQRSLFFALMQIWNISRVARRDEWLSVANSTLEQMSGLSHKTLYNVAEQLAKAGVLRIKKGSRNVSPKYDITFWIKDVKIGVKK